MSNDKYEHNEHAWWMAKRFNQTPGEVMLPSIQRLLSDQQQRYSNFRRLNEAFEFGPGAPGIANDNGRTERNLFDETLAFNHARSAIEAVHAKLIKARTIPTPLTFGAAPLDQQNAKELGKGLLGELQQNNSDQIVEDVTLDGLVCGIGFAFVPHGVGKVQIDWVHPEDVVIDEAEGRYRMPRSVYRRMLIDRDVLLEKYGAAGDNFYGSVRDRELGIITAAQSRRNNEVDVHHNQIEVWCGWHLRSGDDASDGKYCVAVGGSDSYCTLEFADWDRDRFPFAKYVPYPRRRQFHGLSMMADFIGPQREHDLISERTQRGYRTMGCAVLAIPRDAGIDYRDLGNGVGIALEYDANKIPSPDAIKTITPNFVGEQTYNYRTQIIREMIESKGIPSLAMTGQLPQGMAGASGKALRMVEEETAERLTLPRNAKDRFMVDLAWLIIEEAEAIVENDNGYTVPFRAKKALESVRWKDILIARDQFDLIIENANALSQTPAARFDQVQELFKAQVIDKDEFRRLYEIPDLESANEIDLADINIIDTTMHKIIVDGKPLMPLSFDNLQMILMRGRKFYNLCRNKDVEPERLRLLEDYINRAQQMNADAEAKAKADAAAAQMANQQAQGGGQVPPQAA